MPRKKNSKSRREKRKEKQKQVNVELENILYLAESEKITVKRSTIPNPNAVTDTYLMTYDNCKYCKSFHPNLWKFVNLYLDQTDIEIVITKDVIQYYKNLIDHFLETKFRWEHGKPENITYEKIKDLPFDFKSKAVDCLGVALGIGPKTRLGSISYLYDIYYKLYKEQSVQV